NDLLACGNLLTLQHPPSGLIDHLHDAGQHVIEGLHQPTGGACRERLQRRPHLPGLLHHRGRNADQLPIGGLPHGVSRFPTLADAILDALDGALGRTRAISLSAWPRPRAESNTCLACPTMRESTRTPSPNSVLSVG